VAARFCSNCGKPIQPDYQLCPYCGTRVIASTVTPSGTYVRGPLSRARITLFVGLAVAVLAFTFYIVVVDRDLTSLLVGMLIVFLLYGMLIVFRPRVAQSPGSPLS